jgi:hypothetical protein
MFATKPSTYVNADGETFRLKFATKAKKIYLVRPKKGGAPKYIDLFIIASANADLNSEGMMAKITPVLMLAEQLEQAGAAVSFNVCLRVLVKNELVRKSNCSAVTGSV